MAQQPYEGMQGIHGGRGEGETNPKPRKGSILHLLEFKEKEVKGGRHVKGGRRANNVKCVNNAKHMKKLKTREKFKTCEQFKTSE